MPLKERVNFVQMYHSQWWEGVTFPVKNDHTFNILSVLVLILSTFGSMKMTRDLTSHFSCTLVLITPHLSLAAALSFTDQQFYAICAMGKEGLAYLQFLSVIEVEKQGEKYCCIIISFHPSSAVWGRGREPFKYNHLCLLLIFHCLFKANQKSYLYLRFAGTTARNTNYCWLVIIAQLFNV